MTKRSRTAKSLAWIERNAFVGPQSQQVLSFQANLEASQWWPAEKLRAFQEAQLTGLLAHAAKNVPYYENLLGETDFVSGAPFRWERWRELPVLSRETLQNAVASLSPRELPAGHEEIERLRSSGSTGRAVEVATSNLASLWQNVLTLRAQIWAGREFSRVMGVIRKLPPGEALPPDGDMVDRWGNEIAFPFQTGPCARLTAAAEIREQRTWIDRRQPDYLATYPSILRELAAGSPPPERVSVESVSTLGETVDAELRDLVKQKWHCRIADAYSAEEVGLMAIECPEHGGYHVQAESVLLEVLDSEGRLCKPGEIGAVVVTPLFNHAMPLLRYAIGDFAEAGGRCRCGRGLPYLNRILGRHRNMLMLADGRTYWPSFGTRTFARIGPILQQQLHQSAPDRLDASLVVAAPLDAEQEAALKAHIQKALPVPFDIRLSYVHAIERNAGGKFELFTSAVSARQIRSATTSA
jgi:phenylacetate-CoA ligase